MKPSLPPRNMKSGFHWDWSFGIVLALLPLMGSSRLECLGQPANEVPRTKAPEPALAERVTADNPVAAPANLRPPGVKVTRPVAEVLKLANAGVDESVMLAFVAHSPSTFNLSAEAILYLNEVGVPGAVVHAMTRRDQALRALASARRIEVIYQGFYRIAEGPNRASFKLNQTNSTASIGDRIAANLLIADVTMPSPCRR
jgi:hypothetical protein